MNKLFMDELVMPNEDSIKDALGNNYKYWKEIKTTLNAKYEGLKEEWKYYGKKTGWTLKLFYKKRNLFFFSVYEDYFILAFVFSDKAVDAITKSNLPSKYINEILATKKYAGGRGLRIEVRYKVEVKIIIKLTEIKILY